MAGLEGLARYWNESPQIQRSLQMMANVDPEVAMERDLAQAKLDAYKKEQNRQDTLSKVVGQSIAENGGITQELIADVMRIDVDAGLQLMKSVQPDMSYQFNPVTGELVAINKSNGAAMPVDYQGGSGESVPNPTGRPDALMELTPPPGLNPSGRQKWIEEQIKIDAALRETQGKEEIKLESESKIKDAARQDFSSSLNEMETLIDELNKLGGMVSTQNNAFENVVNSVARSGPIEAFGFPVAPGGSYFSRKLGTKEQAIADQIKAIVPVLMRDVKAATGMSAQEVNSIPEMQLLKESVSGDLGVSYEAIKANIERLHKKYGSGGKANLSNYSMEELEKMLEEAE